MNRRTELVDFHNPLGLNHDLLYVCMYICYVYTSSFILYFYQVYISYLFTTFLSQKLNYTVYSSLSQTSLT